MALCVRGVTVCLVWYYNFVLYATFVLPNFIPAY